jgi:glycerol-3-phosphate dehydrogenase
MQENAMPSETDADLLIVGGGINGAGIARDAAGRGLKVVLCEQADLAQATSSASSKLIHGGLRYLEMYEFRLVREALAEREVLLKAAPHIIWPLRFVLPHNKLLRPRWMLRLGLFLYDHIGGKRTLPGTKSLDLTKSVQGAPLADSLTRGFEYSDCWVEDSRLVVLNAMDAKARGADIHVRTRCTSARREGAHWLATLTHRDSGEETRIRAKILVNAAGPWVDRFLRHGLGRNEEAHLRLVKGSHLIVPRQYEGDHAYILQNNDKRVIFAIPYEQDFTLIGTTDQVYDGDPADVRATDEEIDYLLTAVNRYFARPVDKTDIVRTYAGVRPLYDDRTDNPSAVTRDYVFDIEAEDGQPPLLSIYGGKITTYRRLSEHAMEKLGRFVPDMQSAWTAAAPLPGGDLANADFDAFLSEVKARYPFLPERQAWRYARLYGTLAEEFLAGAQSIDGLGRHFGADLYEAEVRYLMGREWARDADDILWRRTKLGLRMSAAERETLQEWLDAEAQTPAVAAQ